jgi:hypothetical protein
MSTGGEVKANEASWRNFLVDKWADPVDIRGSLWRTGIPLAMAR